MSPSGMYKCNLWSVSRKRLGLIGIGITDWDLHVFMQKGGIFVKNLHGKGVFLNSQNEHG
jgi:hypothetical protein